MLGNEVIESGFKVALLEAFVAVDTRPLAFRGSHAFGCKSSCNGQAWAPAAGGIADPKAQRIIWLGGCDGRWLVATPTRAAGAMTFGAFVIQQPTSFAGKNCKNPDNEKL